MAADGVGDGDGNITALAQLDVSVERDDVFCVSSLTVTIGVTCVFVPTHLSLVPHMTQAVGC